MVSLESKFAYIERVNASPKLRAFHDLLSEKNISFWHENNLSDADELFIGIISSIQTSNKEKFETIYQKKSKSNPTKDSLLPFVNDDFLIFSLIVGIKKYDIDTSWIKNVVAIRSRNAITITLENILNENYYSTINLPEVVLMYFQLIDESFITNNLLDSAYKSVSENAALFENRSDFQILCATSAYDIIIRLKNAPEGSEVYLLKQFNLKFVKRIKVLSFLLQLSILLFLLYCLLQLPVYSPELIIWINKYGYVFTVLGALGVTLIGNQFNFIKRKSQELTMRMFGYPRGLIKKIEKKKE